MHRVLCFGCTSEREYRQAQQQIQRATEGGEKRRRSYLVGCVLMSVGR